ncbi:MAG: hypothetical protein ABWY77_09880 [Acidimicrobiia bacterium]
MTDSWTSPARAAEFLDRADRLPFRNDGERVLVADVGAAMPGPVLDLGCGEMGARDDPNDRLCAMEPQLEMLRDAGLIDVDCIWKWRSLALLRGKRPPT